jgi:hypothetical protein
MSWKAFFLIILITLLGIFIYLKIEIVGSPNSSFNTTTRFVLGKYPVARTILGLHSVSDAREEYLAGTGPINIEWFAPQEETIDPNMLSQFAALVEKYTGRPTQVLSGGNLDDGTIQLSDLDSYSLKIDTQQPSGTKLLVFFPEDYSPRPDNELYTTYQESAMVLSLTAHRTFLQQYPQDLNQYLLASMLHEFGNQIGMQETATGNPDCIMNLHAGFNGAPLEASGLSEPQDFCDPEQVEIQNLKLQFGNN